jgi:hypothetical protein
VGSACLQRTTARVQGRDQGACYHSPYVHVLGMHNYLWQCSVQDPVCLQQLCHERLRICGSTGQVMAFALADALLSLPCAGCLLPAATCGLM